jgi:hypothetical protein
MAVVTDIPISSPKPPGMPSSSVHTWTNWRTYRAQRQLWRTIWGRA